MGYKNVRHFAGGKQDWMRHDLPVEGERSEGLQVSRLPGCYEQGLWHSNDQGT